MRHVCALQRSLNKCLEVQGALLWWRWQGVKLLHSFGTAMQRPRTCYESSLCNQEGLCKQICIYQGKMNIHLLNAASAKMNSNC